LNVADPGQVDQAFPTTRWTETEAVARAIARGELEAANALLTRYREPLRAWLVRRRGVDEHQAEDVVHNFYLERILQGDLLIRADRHGGRFRTWLLRALGNFLVSTFRHDNALCRRPERLLALDALQVEAEEPGADTVDEVYEHDWAVHVLQAAEARMEGACREAGHPELVELLRCRYFRDPPMPYDELVARFGYRTPGQATHAVRRARGLFERALNGVLREEAANSAEVEELKRDLLNVLGRSS